MPCFFYRNASHPHTPPAIWELISHAHRDSTGKVFFKDPSGIHYEQKYVPFRDIADVFDENTTSLTFFFSVTSDIKWGKQASFSSSFLDFEVFFPPLLGYQRETNQNISALRCEEQSQSSPTCSHMPCSRQHASPTELLPLVLREPWRAPVETATISHNQDTRLSWKAWTKGGKREPLDGHCEKLSVGMLLPLTKCSRTIIALYITRERKQVFSYLYWHCT